MTLFSGRTIVLSYVLLTALCGAFSFPARAEINSTVTLREYHPQRFGVGAWLVRALDGFRTPRIQEISLDPVRVDALLPETLVPSLNRPSPTFGAKIGQLLRGDKTIRLLSRWIRGGHVTVRKLSPAELVAYFPEFHNHTFTVSDGQLAFADTLPTFGADLVSKHVVISRNYRDVRYAGQIWRDGEHLCFSGNSGTFMKHREDLPGLNPSPEAAPMLTLLHEIFADALPVEYCDRIAPNFGADEAIDQAQKARLQARETKRAARSAPTPELAKKAVTAADAAIAEAKAAEKLAAQTSSAYRLMKKAKTASRRAKWEATYRERDTKAGLAAMTTKAARKAAKKAAKKCRPEVAETDAEI